MLEEELWSKKIRDSARKLTSKANAIIGRKRKIDAELWSVENKLLSEFIKWDFNMTKTKKTLDGLKEFHATRGWIDEGRFDHETHDEYLNYYARTNNRQFYFCEINKDIVPDGCYPFMGDGGYYEGESCVRALTHDFQFCKKWKKMDRKPTVPPKEYSYRSYSY